MSTGMYKGQIRHNTLINKGNVVERDALYHAFAANMLTLGILVDPRELAGMSASELDKAYRAAESVRGADRKWESLYANFPQGVRSSSRLDLLVQQLIHYISYGTVRPRREDDPREPLPLEEAIAHATPLSVVTNYAQALRGLVHSPRALSVQDMPYMQALFACIDVDDKDFLRECVTARFNENVGMLALVIFTDDRVVGTPAVHDLAETMLSHVSEPDAALRIIQAGYFDFDQDSDYVETVLRLNDQDLKGVRVKNIPRRVRRAITRVLRESRGLKEFPADKYLAHRKGWIKAINAAHVGVSNNKRVCIIADAIRGNGEYKTLMSVVDEGLKDATAAKRAVDTTVRLAPGLFMRNLVALAARDFDAVLEGVRVMSTPSISTLASAITAVSRAATATEGFRRIAGMSSQKVSRAAQLSEKQSGVLENALREHLPKALEGSAAPEGPVSVGGADKMPIPTSASSRSATETDRARLDVGQRVKFDYNTIRMFIHWYNTDKGRTDLDLGMVLLDKDFEGLTSWDYGNVHYGGHGFSETVTFSGDITHAPRPQGASEFYDVNISELRQQVPKGKYLVLTCTVFSGSEHSLGSVDHFAGVMSRNEATKGKIFDPRTALIGSTAATKSSTGIVLAVDLESSEVIWLDTDTASSDFASRATREMGDVGFAVEEILNSDRVSCGDILRAWAKVHGVEVDETTPFDKDQVVALL